MQDATNAAIRFIVEEKKFSHMFKECKRIKKTVEEVTEFSDEIIIEEGVYKGQSKSNRPIGYGMLETPEGDKFYLKTEKD